MAQQTFKVTENFFYTDHFNKCRCCFEKIPQISDENSIADWQRDLFHSLTGIEMRNEPEFSSNLCISCVELLKSMDEFRSYAGDLQSEYYKAIGEISETQQQDEIISYSGEISQHSPSSDNSIYSIIESDVDLLAPISSQDELSDNDELPGPSQSTNTDPDDIECDQQELIENLIIEEPVTNVTGTVECSVRMEEMNPLTIEMQSNCGFIHINESSNPSETRKVSIFL